MSKKVTLKHLQEDGISEHMTSYTFWHERKQGRIDEHGFVTWNGAGFHRSSVTDDTLRRIIRQAIPAEREALDHGYNARLTRGRESINECPHRSGLLYDAWLDGWSWADMDHDGRKA